MSEENYTYVSNANGSKERISLRGGSLVISPGQYAGLEPLEVVEIRSSGRFAIVQGIVPGAYPAGSGQEFVLPYEPKELTKKQIEELIESGVGLPLFVVKSRRVSMGSLSGAIQADLNQGDEFLIKSTGAVSVEKPINAPVGNLTRSARLWIEGNKTITFGSGIKVIGSPSFDYSSTTSMNVVNLVTLDNGTSFYAIVPGFSGSSGSSAVKEVTSSPIGKVKPDLSTAGVFYYTPTGAIELEKPINPPAAGLAVEARIVVATEFPVTLKGISWRGVAQTMVPSALTVYEIFLVSDDGGTTYFALGGTALPASVVTLSGQTNGQIPIWNSTTEKFEPGNQSGGTSEKKVEELIERLSIITNEHPTIFTNGPSAGKTPIGLLSGSAEWIDLTSYISVRAPHRLAPRTIVNGNVTPAELNRYYVQQKKGSTITFPVPEGTTTEGELIAVENVSEGPITVKAKLFGVTETTEEIYPGQFVLYWATGNATEWFPILRRGATGDLIVPGLNASTWTTTKLITEGYEEFFKRKPRQGNEFHDEINHFKYHFNGTKWEKSGIYTVIT